MLFSNVSKSLKSTKKTLNFLLKNVLKVSEFSKTEENKIFYNGVKQCNPNSFYSQRNKIQDTLIGNFSRMTKN